MIISIAIFQIRLSSIYKFVILNDLLLKYNHKLQIYIPRNYYNEIINYINLFEINSNYQKYCNKIKSLKFIPCIGKTRSEELQGNFIQNKILDSDIIIWGLENDKFLFPPNKELIKKTIFSKFRACNDIFWNKNFIDIPKNIWVPSNIFLNHYNINNFKKNLGKDIIKRFEFVSPIDICDINNPYLKFNKNYIKSKYKLNKKHTIIHFLSREYLYSNEDYEKKIVDKLIESEDINNSFNILFVKKPYNIINKQSTYRNIPIVDYFDYDYIMRNFTTCVLGGISTAVRESLLYKIPVLDINNIIIHKNNTKNKEIITGDIGLKKRFLNIEINNHYQFEGSSINIEDNWIKEVKKITSTKYDYIKKKQLWFGNKPMISKILELVLEK